MNHYALFSGKAAEYTAGRPAYAEALLDVLYQKVGFSAASVIADIGAGTGKFSRQLLERGSTVICVEPNVDMLQMARQELAEFTDGRVQFLSGDASHTGIPNRQVDFITVAQAFHWFDADAFQLESRRILKPEGKAVLLWNVRDASAEIHAESEALYAEHCPQFHGFSGGIMRDDPRIFRYFSGNYCRVEFDNPLLFDKEKFLNRSLSSSYSLREGDSGYAAYVRALETLFARYADNGILVMPNQTVAYIGSISNV